MLNVKTVTAYPNSDYLRRVLYGWFGLIKVLNLFLWLGTYSLFAKMGYL